MLTPAQVDFFRDQGFLVLDPGIRPGLLDQAVEDMRVRFRRPEGAANYHHGTRIQDGWKFSPAVHRLAVDRNVLSCLRQLFDRAPRPFQTLNFPVGTQQALHSDTMHFNSKPSGYMAGVWIALEEVDEDNGPVVYYPGSHHLPVYDMQDVSVEHAHANYGHYETFIRKRVQESGIEPYTATLRKGEALIWHANLIHGGSEQRNKARTRHSQVTHYFFAGCQYYTPVASTPSAIKWRKPDWIPCDGPGWMSRVRAAATRRLRG